MGPGPGSRAGPGPAQCPAALRNARGTLHNSPQDTQTPRRGHLTGLLRGQAGPEPPPPQPLHQKGTGGRRKETQHPPQQETERTSTLGTRTVTLQNAIYERNREGRERERKERDRSDGLGAGAVSHRHRMPGGGRGPLEHDARFLGRCRNTLLGFQYFTDKTKNTTLAWGSSTHEGTTSPPTSPGWSRTEHFTSREPSRLQPEPEPAWKGSPHQQSWFTTQAHSSSSFAPAPRQAVSSPNALSHSKQTGTTS